MSEVQTTSGWMTRACPLCGATEAGPALAKGALLVVRCRNCSMQFASPVAAEFVTGAFYDRLAVPFYLSADKLESDFAPVRFERELRWFRQYCRSGRVLDVGCSTGAFLHQLQARFSGAYSVMGMDVAGQALTHAESRGVPVCHAPFLEHDFGAQRFDAVTFWAVLEHLHEPGRFLAKAAKLLRPGGHVFLLVPNLGSLAVRLLGARYRYIMPDHLNYFSAGTLQAFAARVPELSVVALRSTHFNPLVIWQDARRRDERVPDAERAGLLKRTTAWKQSAALTPAKWIYSGVERCLGAAGLADNLVMALRRGAA